MIMAMFMGTYYLCKMSYMLYSILTFLANFEKIAVMSPNLEMIRLRHEEIGEFAQDLRTRAFLVAPLVKNPPAVWETWV